MVEWPAVDCPRPGALRGGLVAPRQRRTGLRHAAGRLPLLRGLRIHALVHAYSAETDGGAERDILSAERTSPAASPLHEQEFQRGIAAGRFLSGHTAAAFEGAVRPGSWRSRSGCAADPVATSRNALTNPCCLPGSVGLKSRR